MNVRSRLSAGLLLIALAACSNPTPQLPATTTQSPFATISAPAARSTLPPTWTPSFTPPPSATFTDTPTPSQTPTPSARSICAGLSVLYEIENNQRFAWEGGIPIIAGTDINETVIRFNAVHRQSGAARLVELPGGQMVMAELPTNLLPRPGFYDWTLSVYSEPYGEICERSGTLVALAPADERPGSNE